MDLQRGRAEIVSSLDDTRIPRRGAPQIKWFETEGWTSAWDTIDSVCLCGPQFLEGVRRIIQKIVALSSKDAIARSRDVHFTEIHQALGEVGLMVIGPLRQSYMGNPPGMLKCDDEFPGSRNEAKKIQVVDGELYYHCEMFVRLIESLRNSMSTGG